MSDARYSRRVRELFAAAAPAQPLGAGPGLRVGEAAALERRAWVRFEIRVEDGRIAAGRYRAWGCPHVIAACGLALERVLGQPLAAAGALTAAALAAELDAPADKLGRLLVVEDALRELAAGTATDR